MKTLKQFLHEMMGGGAIGGGGSAAPANNTTSAPGLGDDNTLHTKRTRLRKRPYRRRPIK